METSLFWYNDYMKHYFIVFKLQDGETKNSYSLVNEDILKTIPTKIIQAKKQVKDKLYSKEEFEALRSELV